MSSGAMPKHDLPDDISLRLDGILQRLFGELSGRVRDEVGQLFRFANMNEVQAAVKLLEDRKEPMAVDDIVKELMAGGIWREATGSKGSSAAAEIRRSLSQAARHNKNLCFVDRDKEIIWLPDKDLP